MRRFVFVLLAVLAVSLAVRAEAQSKAVDKAYLREILDVWSSLDVDKAGQYYVQAPDHLFFDIAR